LGTGWCLAIGRAWSWKHRHQLSVTPRATCGYPSIEPLDTPGHLPVEHGSEAGNVDLAAIQRW
jgi:hypothetical protein